MLLIVGLVAVYYNMIIAYVLFYLLASLASSLPWEHCGNWWNTALCREHRGPKDGNGALALNLSSTVSPSEEYWRSGPAAAQPSGRVRGQGRAGPPARSSSALGAGDSPEQLCDPGQVIRLRSFILDEGWTFEQREH